MMRFKILVLFIVASLLACNNNDCPTTPSASDLVFSEIAPTWDEGMPLGNATIGALVWANEGKLRFSLDRVDLWDLRPTDSLAGDNYKFSWVKEQIRKNNYEAVQRKIDVPYEQIPAPSKIPGAALEFSLEQFGEPQSVRLFLDNALCEINWADGMKMQTFVHATEPVGWFVFKNLKEELIPELVAPKYKKTSESEAVNSVDGQDLQRLGYQQGDVVATDNQITYHQKGYGDFYYDVVVRWERKGQNLYGTWSISSSLDDDIAATEVAEAMARGVKSDYKSHLDYWRHYWAQSSVSLPDSVLQKQYYNEMYKFGSATREDSYPISLQAVWTADNGKLPPWKGDYHHDLNTQLSYWPAYAGNRLTEGLGYLNTLWNQRDTYRKYTREFFETDGINVPGVCTLVGEQMGGWTQYSMSQTISAWLAQHFYLHWKYSADDDFLKQRAYPFVKDVAIYLEQSSYVDELGTRRLEFTSSPEFYDNTIRAWFTNMTNYDLALMIFAFDAAEEMAEALNLTDESKHWGELKSQLHELDVDADGSLSIANGTPYSMSHRHFSHVMAIHPLGILDWSDGEQAQQIIKATLKKLTDVGPDYWTGYSYSWFGNLQARAMNGEEAAKALRIFAECFCLPNTFHANGDQSRTGKSQFLYRPFTLEGNFAFASGVHEMLMQSHTGTIRIFPAIPADWNDVSFENLRAVGGYLVSAKREGGEVTEFTIYAEKDGDVSYIDPQSGKQIIKSLKAGEQLSVIG